MALTYPASTTPSPSRLMCPGQRGRSSRVETGVLTERVSVDFEREVVVKRYLRHARGEPAREWRALRLLADHAPGLAPEPLRADLYGDPPVVEMSLLPGEPLGGAQLTAAQESALARALSQLWQS